jgi:hypothetical protein
MPKLTLSAAFAALAVGSVCSSAAAHIELQSPMNRYSDIKEGDNKSCPCGSGTANRSCAKPDERSDPDRSPDRATTFAPGDEITVRFDEYVGHAGRFRIAFDPDGADLADFNEHILLDEPDPTGNMGNMGQASIWQFQVTLPDMECDNCTLQLIQVMDNNQTDPVPDPMLRGGTYFQCADLVLADGTPPGGIPPAAPSDHLGQELGRLTPSTGAAGGGATDTSTAMSATGSTGTGAMAVNPAARTTPASGAASGGALMGSTSPANGADSAAPSPDAASSSGGCSLSGAERVSSRAALGALPLLLALSLRRRARR